MYRIQSATLFTLLALAGCGGGGSSTPAVTPTQPATATELTLSACAGRRRAVVRHGGRAPARQGGGKHAEPEQP